MKETPRQFWAKEVESVTGRRPTLICIGEGKGDEEEEILLLFGIEEVDNFIDKVIASRNRAWPFPPYQVSP
jgi:hypothetical protein